MAYISGLYKCSAIVTVQRKEAYISGWTVRKNKTVLLRKILQSKNIIIYKLQAYMYIAVPRELQPSCGETTRDKSAEENNR
jgi:hypothetical protein